MRYLERLVVRNFKSLREQSLALGALNVFIGGNGVGKSNLIQVFRFLREVVNQNLSSYVGAKGGANGLLYYGRKTSEFMSIELHFSDQKYSNGYELRVLPTDDDSFVIDREIVYFQDKERYSSPYNTVIATGTKESKLKEHTKGVPYFAYKALSSYRVYHFHDTSDSAAVKATGDIGDNNFLRPDAANLAAFLYRLQAQHTDHFRNIESAIRQVAPFFDQFNLQPSRLNPDKIRLEWKEIGSDTYFNASSLSDGTLRFMCLATLLLQPWLPPLVLLDEPELGLHPAAISLLASLLASASHRTQIILATQSVTLVNQFEPEQVWTVDRQDGQSVFRHLKTEDLALWLEKYGDYEGYSLGDLWEKNILGARP